MRFGGFFDSMPRKRPTEDSPATFPKCLELNSNSIYLRESWRSIMYKLEDFD